MDLITVLVEWENRPQSHYLPQSDVRAWYISRWSQTNDQGVVRQLTVICLQVPVQDSERRVAEILGVIEHLWVRPPIRFIEEVEFSSLLQVDSPPSTKYSVVYTDQTAGLSFFGFVKQTEALLTDTHWVIEPALTIADGMTSYRLRCIHRPHEVTVLVQGTTTKRVLVRCEQPQRLYDLMKMYGVHCSQVWDSTIHLSATAPCSALVDYRMLVVSVNTISSDESFDDERAVVYYDDMRHVELRTQRNALRHQPSVSAPLSTEQAYGDQVLQVALYYNTPLATVTETIESDQRFKPTTRIDEPNVRYMLEVEGHSELVFGAPEGEIEGGSGQVPSPLPCFCCYGTTDAFIQCGHLCCTRCIRQMKRSTYAVTCGVCREPSSYHGQIIIPYGFDFICDMCFRPKEWVTTCGHVTCMCFNTRCPVCGQVSLTLRRVYS